VRTTLDESVDGIAKHCDGELAGPADRREEGMVAFVDRAVERLL